MTNLVHLRKQAKLFLRWHRERYFPVATKISQHLTRFRGLNATEVFTTEFKLSDAQELVARENGFDNWSALRKGIDAMQTNDKSEVKTSTILSAEPQLFVSDIQATSKFYVGKLGFTVVFSYGEPAFYAQIGRGAARLNLRKVEGPVFAEGFRSRERDALSATLALDHAKALFLEFQENGIEFHQPLRTEPWGARTFIVEDPDGNLICFSGPSRP
ncbi:MAG: VOC family protein [Pseudomonadota bacterium]